MSTKAMASTPTTSEMMPLVWSAVVNVLGFMGGSWGWGARASRLSELPRSLETCRDFAGLRGHPAPSPLRRPEAPSGGRPGITRYLCCIGALGLTAPAALAAATPVLHARSPGTQGQERGERGKEYPEVVDSRAGPLLVHEDGRGRCDHALVGLTGAPGAGFVAAWRDERDGIDGIYMARLDPAGDRLEPDRPIHGPDPDDLHDEASVALTPEGALGIAWVADVGRGREVRLRVITAEREDLGELPLGPALRDEPELGPRITVGADGGFALATRQGLRTLLRRFAPDRSPRGSVVPLGTASRPALGPPRIAQNARGDVLAGWNTQGGIALELRTGEGERLPIALDPGQFRDVTADPQGGWYVLVQTSLHLLLRHRDAEGHIDRSDAIVGEGLYPYAQIVAWDEGLAILTEVLERDDDRRTRYGPIELHLLPPDGTFDPERRALAVVAEESRGATEAWIASAGNRLMVAWNEHRGANDDIYFRTIGGEERMGRVRRLNDDVSSSHQRHGAIDGQGGRAVLAWLDDRSGRDRPFVRLLDESGAFLSDEIAVPASPPGADEARKPGPAAGPNPRRARARGRRRSGPRAVRPTVTLGSDGGFLATWKEQDRAGFSLFSQAFGPDGRSRNAASQVDPGLFTPPGWGASSAAIPGARGYLLVWVRERVGVCLVRLTSAGAPAGDVEILSETKDCRNPSIAHLDDRRFIVAWDVARDENVNDMRGRFLREDGRLDGPELRFTRSRTSYDADPTVAPAGRGFLLAWVARKESDRDVYARLYDRDGAPQGRPLAITPLLGAQDQPCLARLSDGSWAVAWRDDLSGTSHVLVRRIDANGRDLGPVRRLHGLGGGFVDETLDPDIAALGDGLLGLWSDVRRSRGFDVAARILGPGFDFESDR